MWLNLKQLQMIWMLFQRNMPESIGIKHCSTGTVSLSPHIKKTALNVICDPDLFKSHLTKTIQLCSLHLRKMSKIKRCLSWAVHLKIILAYVSSRLH